MVGREQPRVRSAAFDEIDARMAYRLWALRESVFVVEQGCAYPELDGRDPEPATRHLWVEGDDGAPTAYLRILDEGDHARIGRVLVTERARGNGLAAAVLGAALRELEEAGQREVHLDAQTYLRGWYERWGFVVSGAEFLDDGIWHVPMRRSAHS